MLEQLHEGMFVDGDLGRGPYLEACSADIAFALNLLVAEQLAYREGIEQRLGQLEQDRKLALNTGMMTRRDDE